MSIQLKDCVRLEFGTTDNPTNGILLCTLHIKYPSGAVLSISPTGEVNIKYGGTEE
jgi:hypothetical protein